MGMENKSQKFVKFFFPIEIPYMNIVIYERETLEKIAKYFIPLIVPCPALGTEKFSLKIDVRDQTLWKYKTCSRINDISLYLIK